MNVDLIPKSIGLSIYKICEDDTRDDSYEYIDKIRGHREGEIIVQGKSWIQYQTH